MCKYKTLTNSCIWRQLQCSYILSQPTHRSVIWRWSMWVENKPITILRLSWGQFPEAVLLPILKAVNEASSSYVDHICSILKSFKYLFNHKEFSVLFPYCLFKKPKGPCVSRFITIFLHTRSSLCRLHGLLLQGVFSMQKWTSPSSSDSALW